MKTILHISIAAAIVLGGLFITTHFTHTPSVHAQGGCDASSFSGAYGYTLSGYVYDQQGNLYILANVGRIVADGAGAVTGGDTYSFDGTIVKRTYTGTYTMNADCTGSMVLPYTIGTTTGTAHGDIVAVNNSREINYVQTDAPYVLTGVFKKQIQ